MVIPTVSDQAGYRLSMRGFGGGSRALSSGRLLKDRFRFRLGVVAGGLGLLAAVAGCASPVEGVAVPALTRYVPPADMTGYGLPPDQPLPVPPTSMASYECPWMEEALPLLAPLAIRYANGTMSGCQMGAGDTSHEIIQVRLNAPYRPIRQATAMHERVDIVGLPGRMFVLSPVEDPTFCTVELDIRAYASFVVDAYDHRDFAPSAPDNKANCELAKAAAEILVKRYVPLAGGTPWECTPQRPAAERLRAVEPCEFVANPIYSPVIVDDPKTREESWGTACVYADENGTLTELLTTGTGGLEDLPRQLDGGVLVDDTFGDYPARVEQAENSCSIAVETDDGQAVGVSYRHNGPTDEACPIVEANLSDSLASQLE